MDRLSISTISHFGGRTCNHLHFLLSISFETNIKADPLGIPFFDLAGCQAIPQLGVYDQDDYILLSHQLLLELPFESAALSDHLPSNILDELDACEQGQELYIIFYDRHERLGTSDIAVNVLFHPWIFKNPQEHKPEHLMSDTGVDIKVRCGGWVEWLGENIEEVPNGLNLPQELCALPLNRVDTRLVTMHYGRFSPHNCHVDLRPTPSPLHAFFSVCIHNGKAIVCFHVIPGTMEINTKLATAIGNAETLQDLVTSFVKKPDLDLFKLRILSIIYPLTQIYK